MEEGDVVVAEKSLEELKLWNLGFLVTKVCSCNKGLPPLEFRSDGMVKAPTFAEDDMKAAVIMIDLRRLFTPT